MKLKTFINAILGSKPPPNPDDSIPDDLDLEQQDQEGVRGGTTQVRTGLPGQHGLGGTSGTLG